jgi:hypothetical protein
MFVEVEHVVRIVSRTGAKLNSDRFGYLSDYFYMIMSVMYSLCDLCISLIDCVCTGVYSSTRSLYFCT